MSEHTPGPWYCIGGAVYADEEEKRPIARMVRDDTASKAGIYPVERDANARLIAAAPELLEALQLIIKRGYRIETSDYQTLLDAIAKAQPKREA